MALEREEVGDKRMSCFADLFSALVQQIKRCCFNHARTRRSAWRVLSTMVYADHQHAMRLHRKMAGGGISVLEEPFESDQLSWKQASHWNSHKNHSIKIENHARTRPDNRANRDVFLHALLHSSKFVPFCH